MGISRFCALLAAGLALAAPPIQAARVLSVCIPANPFPPLTFPDHEGQGQWLLRNAVERQGDTVLFAAVPWMRCTEGVQRGNYDAAMPPTALFANTLALPQADGHVDVRKSIGVVTMVVLRRSGSNADWDGTKFSGLNSPVMFNKGVVSIRDKLTKLGVTGDEGASANESLLRKLIAGRADLLIMNSQAAATELADPEYRGKLELLPTPFLSLTTYVAFNRAFQDAHPAYVEALWSEIARLRATPEWARMAPDLAR